MPGRFLAQKLGAGGSCLHCLMVNPPLKYYISKTAEDFLIVSYENVVSLQLKLYPKMNIFLLCLFNLCLLYFSLNFFLLPYIMVK